VRESGGLFVGRIGSDRKGSPVNTQITIDRLLPSRHDASFAGGASWTCERDAWRSLGLDTGNERETMIAIPSLFFRRTLHLNNT
jgi:hypothetical protein